MDLERVCMEVWSLILGQVFSKLIRHYRRRLWYIGKRRLQKAFNKQVPITVAKVFWRKTFISYVIYPHFQFFYVNERYVYLYKFEICLQIEQKDAN